MNMNSARKVYEVRRPLDRKNNDISSKFPAALKELLAEQKVLNKKITDIDNRLRFGYSEPLNDYKMQLVRDDIFLSAKVLDELLKLSKAS